MTQEEVLDVFRECGAMMEGHFILSSGLRSPFFIQKAIAMSANGARTMVSSASPSSGPSTAILRSMP